MNSLAAGSMTYRFISLGVLQHDDVAFEPPLPMWKKEAIHSMNMVCGGQPDRTGDVKCFH